ncbi:MAG: YciI family protein [Burkholderiales bacterium]
MSEFVLLYRNTTQAHQEAMGSPERAQQSMTKWRAWFKVMSEHGQLKSVGQPLERVGKVVGGKKKSVTDGPYAEAKDVVGGFSIVEAKDLAQAAQIASGCPILEVGGSVEVRPVMQMNM